MITIDHTEPCCRCGHIFDPNDQRYAEDLGNYCANIYRQACYEKKFG